MHARIAFFRSRTGSFEEVIRLVEAPGGLLGIFRQQQGFQSYELIDTGSGLVSVSHWASSKQADTAERVAVAWAIEHIDHLVKLEQSNTGEVVLSSLSGEGGGHLRADERVAARATPTGSFPSN